MISAENKREYYQALIDKKTEYEGIFFAEVKPEIGGNPGFKDILPLKDGEFKFFTLSYF